MAEKLRDVKGYLTPKGATVERELTKKLGRPLTEEEEELMIQNKTPAGRDLEVEEIPLNEWEASALTQVIDLASRTTDIPPTREKRLEGVKARIKKKFEERAKKKLEEVR